MRPSAFCRDVSNFVGYVSIFWSVRLKILSMRTISSPSLGTCYRSHPAQSVPSELPKSARRHQFPRRHPFRPSCRPPWQRPTCVIAGSPRVSANPSRKFGSAGPPFLQNWRTSMRAHRRWVRRSRPTSRERGRIRTNQTSYRYGVGQQNARKYETAGPTPLGNKATRVGHTPHKNGGPRSAKKQDP